MVSRALTMPTEVNVDNASVSFSLLFTARPLTFIPKLFPFTKFATGKQHLASLACEWLSPVGEPLNIQLKKITEVHSIHDEWHSCHPEDDNRELEDDDQELGYGHQ